MIFVTLGSQKFQFNRLLKEIDKLVEEGNIKDEIFAQIGYSDYIPKNYNYKKFLDRDEFDKIMSICNTVITHGGTGAIINAVKKDKKVIAIPRLKEFGEHVDDHQVEIVEQFKNAQIICGIIEIKELNISINSLKDEKFKKYNTNTSIIIDSLDRYIESI